MTMPVESMSTPCAEGIDIEPTSIRGIHYTIVLYETALTGQTYPIGPLSYRQYTLRTSSDLC